MEIRIQRGEPILPPPDEDIIHLELTRAEAGRLLDLLNSTEDGLARPRLADLLRDAGVDRFPYGNGISGHCGRYAGTPGVHPAGTTYASRHRVSAR